MFYFLPAAGACKTVTSSPVPPKTCYRNTGHTDQFLVAGSRGTGCRYLKPVSLYSALSYFTCSGIEASSSPSSLSADNDFSDARTLPAASVTVKEGPSDGWSPDESKQGTVSCRTYSAYISAAGGIVAVLAVLVAAVIAQGTKVFSVWWLAYWIEQGSGTVNVSLQ